MADGDPTECRRCNGKNFVIYDQVLYPDRKTVGRVFQCRDCIKTAFDEMVSSLSPTTRTRYAKTKLRTDYYGTVTIKDIIKDDNET